MANGHDPSRRDTSSDSKEKGIGNDATLFLSQLADGDTEAEGRLYALVYDDLHARAALFLQDERPGHTLQATALVNEAWLKLIARSKTDAANRRHFVCLAARAMRQILVDHARAKNRQKRRSASGHRVTIHGELVAADNPDGLDLLAINEALDRLREMSSQLAVIVELRFFGGLSREDIAELTGSSRTTVAREWRAARAMLANLMEG